MSKNNGTVYLMALLYSIIIGFAFLTSKLALRYADPIDLLAYRFALSYFALTIAIRAGWVRIPKREKKEKRLPLLGISLMYPTLFFGFQTFGLTAATTSGAGIFSATTPVFALLLGALLLKEKSNALQKLSVAVSVGGLAFMSAASGDSLQGTTATGATLLLLSALSLAVYGVLARMLRNSYSAVQISHAMMRTGVVIFTLLALIRHAVNGTMPDLFAPLGEPGFWLPLLYISLMTTLVSSWLSNAVLARLEAFKVSLFVNLGNMISIASGVLLMNDHWSSAQTVGTACLLAGVIGANSRSLKRRLPAKPVAKGVDLG
ncbi:DMT family transporter [Cohnella zeiphila]|uniref:DMT family transporter n=1 Tax=Cohnella zeiphila TaxID=2761120 RepID=A0A7X0SP86_9BACL|nr:DMT family transporter [Cohnella zeiphila]MBB6733662.1 DMT family transporter [Cohnella zeiphila]